MRNVGQPSPRRHPSQHRRGGKGSARLTITIVEGRGIWLELDGDLVEGALDQVRTRCDRLALLGFDVVIVDATRISSIDECGAALLGGFVDCVDGRGGGVVILDPDDRVASARDRLVRATITDEPPGGTWWLP